jgi:hypothetical protein
MRRSVVLITAAITCSVLVWGQNAVSPGRHVLIAGGIDNNTVGGTHLGLASTEIYDEPSHSFVSTGSMMGGRTGHSATRLMDGKVLVAGGDGADTDHAIASAEVYDPAGGSFEPVANMTSARVGHVTGLLRSGKVLLAGGEDSTWTNLATAELFDPSSGTFSVTGQMTTPRTGATATVLNNGKVLVVDSPRGGDSNSFA